jgi:hypothetical protein
VGVRGGGRGRGEKTLNIIKGRVQALETTLEAAKGVVWSM